MPATDNKWVNGLDSLRFILALFVVFSHLHNPFSDQLKAMHSTPAHLLGTLLDHLFPGVVAVSAFFVISGFVIHYANKDRQKLDVTAFLVRRWGRVGLPLLLILALSRHFNGNILSMVWSLYCELIFYTLYPLLFYSRSSWLTKTGIAWGVSIATTALLITIDMNLLHWKIFSQRNMVWQLCITLINLPVWMMGILIAEQIDKKQKEVKGSVLLFIRCLVYILSILVIFLRMRYRLNTIYTCLILSPLLYMWLDMEIRYFSTHKAYRWLEHGGKFSYSLYLWHLFAFLILGKALPLTAASYVVYAASAIAFSYIAYLVVERPSHLLSRRLASAIGRASERHS